MTNPFEQSTDRAALRTKVSQRRNELATLSVETGPGLIAALHRNTSTMAEAFLKAKQVI